MLLNTFAEEEDAVTEDWAPQGRPQVAEDEYEEEFDDEEEETPARLIPERPKVDYNIRLSPQNESALAGRLLDELTAYDQAVATRLSMARIWRWDYEGIQADTDLSAAGPWQNSNQARADITQKAVQQHIVRLTNALTAANPPFQVVAKRPRAIPYQEIIGDVVMSHMEEADWLEVFARLIQNVVLVGNALLRIEWQEQYEYRPSLKATWDEKVAQELILQGAGPDEAMMGAIETDATGSAALKLKYDRELVFDGVSLDVVLFEDMVVLPPVPKSGTSPYALGEKVRLTGAELMAGAEQGIYRKKAVAKVLELQSDPLSSADDASWGTITQVWDALPDHEGVYHREYDCVELDYFDDIAGMGFPIWNRITYHPESQTILRLQKSPDEHGKSRYLPFGYKQRDGSFWASGIAEVVAVYQATATALLNGTLDLADMIKGMAGGFVYGPTFFQGVGSDTPGAFHWQPGKPMGVRNIHDMRSIPGFETLPPAIREMRECLVWLDQQAQLMTATSNPSMGAPSQGNLTAREVSVVQANATVIWDYYAQSFLRRSAQAMDRVRSLIKQHGFGREVQYRKSASAIPLTQLPDGSWARVNKGVTGNRTEEGFPDFQVQEQVVEGEAYYGTVPGEFLGHDVDFVPSGLNQFPDYATRFQRDTMVLQAVRTDPVMGQVPEVTTMALMQYIDGSRANGAKTLNALIAEQLAQFQAQQQMMQAQQQMMQMAMLQSGADQQGAQQRGADEESRFQRERAQREDMRAQQQHELGLLSQIKSLVEPPAEARNQKAKKK